MTSNIRNVEARYSAGAATRRANLELVDDLEEPTLSGRHASDGNIRTVNHRKPDEVTFEVLRYRTATSPRGFVRYIHIRPDKSYRAWICDDCGKPITESQFMTHAEDEH